MCSYQTDALTRREMAQRSTSAQPGSPFHMAPRKSGYWQWVAAQVKCPGRTQVKCSSCRETTACPQRSLLDGHPPTLELFFLLILLLLCLPWLRGHGVPPWKSCTCSVSKHPSVTLIQSPGDQQYFSLKFSLTSP